MEVEQTLEELEAMYSDEDKKKSSKGKKAKGGKAGGGKKQQPSAPSGADDANNGGVESATDGGNKDEASSKAGGGKATKAKAATDAAEPVDGSAAAAAAGNDEGETAKAKTKTAAEKRKEKKEREKAKKAEVKKTDDSKSNEKNASEEKKPGEKAEVKKTEDSKSNEKNASDEKAEIKKAEETHQEGDGEGGDEGKGEEKGEMTAAKKKKLKKKEKEKEKKTAAAAASSTGGEGAKKPTSGVAKLIKQQLERQREEEERLRRQEEEAERKREEERLKREEEERLERERKERRKQKEKERKKRLKEEGKLLTQKQKQDRQRLQQMIQLSGVELPAAAENESKAEQPADAEGQQQQQQQKKKPKYEKLKRNKPTSRQAEQAAADSTQTAEQQQPALAAVKEAENAAVPDSWEDAALETTWDRMEASDEWDAVADQSAARLRKEEKKKQTRPEDSSDDEDEDDEDASDDDSGDGSSSGEASDDSGGGGGGGGSGDPIERARQRIAQRREAAMAAAEAAAESAASEAELRCPLVCVLGHVDTGKTSILDKLRKTHVQDGEAGGITQQIGATNVPVASILSATRMVKSFRSDAMKLPGLLIIDTPGHESFSNLRSRGSSLCDVAILVVDIMHGIEPQTIESIQLLKQRGTPFIVALNKIDRLYDWQKNANADVFDTLKKQGQATRNDFEDRLKLVVAHFAMQELNVCLSRDNKNFDDYISLVPTSAHSGDGMGNLMAHICELSLRKLRKRLVYHEDLEATVMEVKEITGLGTTIDVCLVNGRLKESETIILAGQEGPIVTQIRGLLMPMPMKELRVKNQYEKFKEVKGAQAVKIIAKDLEKSLAGLPLYSSKDADEIEVFKMDVSAKLSKVLKSIEVQDVGVYVQASTLGSLEALLLFLRTEKIPYCGINIGPVHKRDVTKCSVMVEKDPQWAVILAFDVKVEREAQELADSHGVRIFTADIIYHLSDAFMKWRDERLKAERDKYKDIAVFPCKLRVLPQYIFNSRDPIVCGVTVEAGIIKVGTPLAVPSKDCVYLGRVESLEQNHKKVDEAKRGAELCIKIAAPPGDAPKMYGRHFDHNDLIMSRVSRESIDALKQYFRGDLTKDDWKLVIELKKAYNVF